jgi:hypothetical protein
MPANGNRYSHRLLAYDFEQIVRRGLQWWNPSLPGGGERAVAFSARDVYIPICRKTLWGSHDHGR